MNLPTRRDTVRQYWRVLLPSQRYSKVQGLSARSLTNLSDVKCVRGGWLVRGVAGFASPVKLTVLIPVFRQALARTAFSPRRLPSLHAT